MILYYLEEISIECFRQLVLNSENLIVVRNVGFDLVLL